MCVLRQTVERMLLWSLFVLWLLTNADAATTYPANLMTVTENLGTNLSFALAARQGPPFTALAGAGECIALGDVTLDSLATGQYVLTMNFQGSDFAGNWAEVNANLIGYDAVDIGKNSATTFAPGTPTFSAVSSGGTVISPLPFDNRVPGGHAILGLNIDVTDFLQQLPFHNGFAAVPLLLPAFAVRLAGGPLDQQVDIFAEYIQYRDGSAADPFLPAVSITGGPTGQTVPGFHFPVRGRGRYDPPATSAFTYQIDGDGFFTEIFDFPTGFASPFTVSIGGVVLGQFSPGDTVDFSGYPGGGVKSFSVSGISPLVDGADPLAFPLGLDFSPDAEAFDMLPGLIVNAAVPEPSTFALAGLGVLVSAFVAWRRKYP